MTWSFGGGPQVGDWIKTTHKVPVTSTDALADSGIPAGTRGVVTEVSGLLGGHIVARVDGDIFGSITVRLRSGQVRVVRRGGGIENYEKSASRRAQVRLGAALALLGPLAYFCISYVIRCGDRDGLLLLLAEGAIYGALETIAYVMSNPAQGILYCAVVWAVGRVAFGRW